MQGGPHMHTIGGIAVALGEAITPEFKEYQKQVFLSLSRFSQTWKLVSIIFKTKDLPLYQEEAITIYR